MYSKFQKRPYKEQVLNCISQSARGSVRNLGIFSCDLEEWRRTEEWGPLDVRHKGKSYIPKFWGRYLQWSDLVRTVFVLTKILRERNQLKCWTLCYAMSTLLYCRPRTEILNDRLGCWNLESKGQMFTLLTGGCRRNLRLDMSGHIYG